MCGRYELHAHPAAIALAFGLAELPHVVPRYNIAPMTDVPVVRIGASGQRECHMLRWGLVPRSAKDASVGARMVNARGETLRERPAFRLPFRWHRCVLPANGFYEWTDGASPSVRRQPLHISLPDHALFALAGLYERWLDADGQVLDTCTIVTTSANAAVARFGDRMPVIIAPGDYDRWLAPDDDRVDDLIAPYDASRLRVQPVSTRVNNVRNEGPDLLDPVDVALEEPSPAAAELPEQESLF